MEIPGNLEAWFNERSGPVVLVVQPKPGISGQSSLTHMLEQPYGMMFDSYADACDYHRENSEKFKHSFMTGCYPVFRVPNEGQHAEGEQKPVGQELVDRLKRFTDGLETEGR